MRPRSMNIDALVHDKLAAICKKRHTHLWIAAIMAWVEGEDADKTWQSERGSWKQNMKVSERFLGEVIHVPRKERCARLYAGAEGLEQMGRKEFEDLMVDIATDYRSKEYADLQIARMHRKRSKPKARVKKKAVPAPKPARIERVRLPRITKLAGPEPRKYRPFIEVDTCGARTPWGRKRIVSHFVDSAIEGR